MSYATVLVSWEETDELLELLADAVRLWFDAPDTFGLASAADEARRRIMWACARDARAGRDAVAVELGTRAWSAVRLVVECKPQRLRLMTRARIAATHQMLQHARAAA